MHTNMTLQFSNTNLQKTKEHTDYPVGQNKKSKRLYMSYISFGIMANS